MPPTLASPDLGLSRSPSLYSFAIHIESQFNSSSRWQSNIMYSTVNRCSHSLHRCPRSRHQHSSRENYFELDNEPRHPGTRRCSDSSEGTEIPPTTRTTYEQLRKDDDNDGGQDTGDEQERKQRIGLGNYLVRGGLLCATTCLVI